jgi:acetyl esterase/lipase
MNIIIFIIQLLAIIAACLAALISIPMFFAFRWPAPTMWGLKVFASALSPVFILIGVLTTVVGLATGSLFISLTGLYVFLVYTMHFILVTRPPAFTGNFDQVFGPDWKTSKFSGLTHYFLPNRTSLFLPSVPEPRFEQDISFATIPGTDRALLCDLWQPPVKVKPSGLAFIFMHGSAFYFLDKDCGTRTFFRYLAAQGHVIMDIAYRLAPETDIMGMVHDVRRAIVWMKEHADNYHIDPERIILGGGSAGGHLAMLAAYTADKPEFTPMDLSGKDTHVHAVISIYGSNDLKALYYHTNQHLTTRNIPGAPLKKVPAKMPGFMVKLIGKDYHRLGLDKDLKNIGTMPPLMGGHPDECPEKYALYSPITHIHAACPPTLLIHGEHDIMAPVSGTRDLYARLVEEGIPAVLHLLPQTDHAFDMMFPKIAPATHNAIYDVERFMALMALRKGRTETIVAVPEKNLAATGA